MLENNTDNITLFYTKKSKFMHILWHVTNYIVSYDFNNVIVWTLLGNTDTVLIAIW